ncbi:MAG TPA: DUF134 domain-containing protein [Bacilli bacterium]|nr:DUF134 domain-containing protein [Bacilli bacterium]
MARPVKSRIVCSKPKVNTFGPRNCDNLDCIFMTLEEYEAIRLIDYEDLTQEEASRFMDVARTTIQGIYDNARKKVADALVNGKMIKIEGGNYNLCTNMPYGRGCNQKSCRRFGRNK